MQIKDPVPLEKASAESFVLRMSRHSLPELDAVVSGADEKKRQQALNLLKEEPGTLKKGIIKSKPWRQVHTEMYKDKAARGFFNQP